MIKDTMNEKQINTIPEGWEEVTRLSDYGYTVNGLSGKKKEDFGTGEPFVTYLNVFQNSAVNINQLDFVKIKKGEKQNQLEYGDIIFTTSSETVEEVGMTSVVLFKKDGYYLNSFCFILRLFDKKWLDPKFSQYLFRSEKVRDKISLIGQGSTRYNLSKTRLLNELDFIIPKSLSEQTQIANILSKVDKAIAETEALIAKYQRIKTGLMQDLLTKGIDENGNIRSEKTHKFKDSPLGRIPVEWECVKFGEFIELVHGYQFRNYDFTESGIPIVKIGQVKGYGLDLSECSFIEPERLNLFKKQIIHNEDVLMALTGATLGKACQVSGLNIPLVQNYRVGRFEPIFTNDIDKSFLLYTLKSELFLSQVFSNVNEAAQGNVGKTDFVKSYFIKPPFEEQLVISEKIRQIQDVIGIYKKDYNKYSLLKTGLMQDLLSGKVRVNHLIKEKETV